MIDKEPLRIKELEHAGIEKAGQLFQDMLYAASMPLMLNSIGAATAFSRRVNLDVFRINEVNEL